MKPNFALTLSFEGISLLHRAFPGWHMVGEVGLDTDDLSSELVKLRNRAEALDVNPIRSKLVIPNDQIRYLHFDSEGLEADEIAAAVYRALEGATPYALKDLVYDWSIGAGQVYVAAVARETLSEAEAFASEHGFNPLCFVAVPASRDFVGEPWFGETNAAPTLRPEGTHIDRDTAAVRVIGMAPAAAASTSGTSSDLSSPPNQTPDPEPEIPPQPEPEPEPDLPPQPEPQPEPDLPPDPGTPPTPEPEIEPVPGTPPSPQPDIPPEPTPTPDPDIPPQPGVAHDMSGEPSVSTEDTSLPHPEISLTSDDAVAVSQDPAEVSPPVEPSDETAHVISHTGTPDSDGSPSDRTAPDTSSPAPVSFSSIRARRDDMPTAARRLSGATRDSAAKDAEPPVRDGLRATPALGATAPAAAPTETGDAPAGKVTGTPQDALHSTAAARIGATLRPTDADRMSLVDDDSQRATADLDQARDHDDDEGDIPPPPAFMADRVEPEPEYLPAAPQANTPTAALTAEPSFTSRRKGGKPDKRRLGLRQPARSSPEVEHEQEKQRMTIFGARKTSSVGGKPRFLGLILTAVLLIFLVGVAAWASIFLEDGISSVLRDNRGSEPEQVVATPDAEIDPNQTARPADMTPPDDAAGEDTVVAALPGVTSDVDEEPRTAQPEPSPAELTEQQALSRYAVTGIWQRAPEPPGEPAMQTLDDFYLTSIDPDVLQQDAVALPDPGTLRGDTRPDTPAAPPAADTMFTMDTRGLVQPTRDGALTPDGVRVYAGQPALVPPERPAETLAQPGEDPEEAAARIAALERISALRPRVRPGDLSETNERETLGGRTRNELAGLRPRLRPQSAQELAEQALAASTADDAVASVDISPDPDAVTAALEAAAAVPAPDPFAGATAQAVKVSVKPSARPGNFESIVQRSQRQAEQQAARTASVAVPRDQRIAPSGPTPTTVARAATEKNALQMRRVNLIGVYGTTSNRRALVRLANGSYKKVKVGDRLDGGRVAAIGTSELRYVKSGRSVTLTMPRG